MLFKVLIVKHGALGDVVRTSYFIKSLKDKFLNSIEIHWITNISSLDILRFNPFIDKIVFNFSQILDEKYDIIYSLDDESDIVNNVMSLNYKKIVGVSYINGYFDYCDKSSYWFDMGLQSKYGKKKADSLKKDNTKTHSEIFSKIFMVEKITPHIFNSQSYLQEAEIFFKNHNNSFIGINAYSGGRWSSKELLKKEYIKLINLILDKTNKNILLIGAFNDFKRNLEIKNSIKNNRIFVLDSDSSILKMSAFIYYLDILISTDSLALHLAIANKVKSISFFSPTSAAEIDIFKNGYKIVSKSDDYCSYKKDADNSSITADRIFKKIKLTI